MDLDNLAHDFQDQEKHRKRDREIQKQINNENIIKTKENEQKLKAEIGVDENGNRVVTS